MDFVNTKERKINVDGLNINYKIYGEGNIPIVLLHGWGLTSDKYTETANQLSSLAKIIVPDLPGFGKSDNPPETWGVDDYVELVRNFVKNISCHSEHSTVGQYSKVILIGHSFGGRIAIKFAAKYPEEVKVLILTGAAGIKHPLTLKQKMFNLSAKIGKIIFALPLVDKIKNPAQKLLYRAAREKDYFEAKGVMKETFKKVIAEDLTPYLGKIKMPTLLLWGKNDRSTPIKDAYIMNKEIKNSVLKAVENANHSLPYRNSGEFCKIISEYIKKID